MTLLTAFYKIILLLLSVIFTLLLIEFGARAYVSMFPSGYANNYIDFRKSIPEPYKNSTYDVKSFIDQEYGKIGWYTPEGTRLVLPEDFSIDYLHIENTLRRTSFQPEVYNNTIYVFGGSTIFCAEVPDEYTVTSVLQKLINDKYPNKYKVENYGTTSVISAQELERLRTVSLKPGDIVIFYDGANDALQSIYNNDPEGYILGKNYQIIQESGPFEKFMIKFHTKWGKYSKFVYYFLDPYDYINKPAHLSDKKHVDDLSYQMKEVYVRNISEAKTLSESQGALFFHFLQPTIYSGRVTTIYEGKLKSNSHLISAGIEESLIAGYKQLVPSLYELRSNHQVNSYDLTRLFDSRDKREGLFLDWVHVADKGNYYIAKKIFDTLDGEQKL